MQLMACLKEYDLNYLENKTLEGLFSFVYTMKGPTDAPKVRVQPLSILTPGAFRKLFRSDIPEPKK